MIITQFVLSGTLVSTGPLTTLPYFIPTCQRRVLHFCSLAFLAAPPLFTQFLNLLVNLTEKTGCTRKAPASSLQTYLHLHPCSLLLLLLPRLSRPHLHRGPASPRGRGSRKPVPLSPTRDDLALSVTSAPQGATGFSLPLTISSSPQVCGNFCNLRKSSQSLSCPHIPVRFPRPPLPSLMEQTSHGALCTPLARVFPSSLSWTPGACLWLLPLRQDDSLSSSPWGHQQGPAQLILLSSSKHTSHPVSGAIFGLGRHRGRSCPGSSRLFAPYGLESLSPSSLPVLRFRMSSWTSTYV